MSVEQLGRRENETEKEFARRRELARALAEHVVQAEGNMTELLILKAPIAEVGSLASAKRTEWHQPYSFVLFSDARALKYFHNSLFFYPSLEDVEEI